MVDETYNRHIRRLERRIAQLELDLITLKARAAQIEEDADTGADSYLKTEHIDQYTGIANEPIITFSNGVIHKTLIYGPGGAPATEYADHFTVA